MKKIIRLVFFVTLLCTLAALGWYFYNANKYTPQTYITTPSDDSSLVATSTISKDKNGNILVIPGAKVYTLTEIANHNTTSSCYSVISSVVYDLTMWVNLHPGGKETILSMCGGDGTQSFMEQHKGRTKFMNILARYKIGITTQ